MVLVTLSTVRSPGTIASGARGAAHSLPKHTMIRIELVEDGLPTAVLYDYVDAIAVLFPAADVAAGRAAAQQALTDAGGDGTSFQASADAVLDALDEGMGLRLRCPGTNLTSFYGVSCP